MGVFDALRALVSGDRSGDGEDTYTYRCRDCDREFESPRRHVTDASCPACDSGDVRVSDDPYLDEG